MRIGGNFQEESYTTTWEAGRKQSTIRSQSLIMEAQGRKEGEGYIARQSGYRERKEDGIGGKEGKS